MFSFVFFCFHHVFLTGRFAAKKAIRVLNLNELWSIVLKITWTWLQVNLK